MSNYSRREFLRIMGAATGGLVLSACVPGLNPVGPREPISDPTVMPYRRLGGTGQSVSLLGIGGESAIDSTNQTAAIEILNYALDNGVNYLDTAWYYNGGQSERNIGEVLATRRDEVFLAGKSAKRDYSGVMSDIEESLSRLKTDRIDLYQLHDVRTHGHLNTILDQGGAVEAMEELRDRGVIRLIGITGHHDPSVLLHAINRYSFDTILLSLNAADRWYLPFQHELLQTAIEKNIGVIAMKVFGKGRIVGEGKLTARQAMNYVYSFPISCGVVGVSSLDDLIQDISITNEFDGPLSAAALEAMEDAVEPIQEHDGNWFKMGYEEV